MPRCDSSQTYARAVRPGPSPADLLPGWATGVSEVSRFSCMKYLGVSGVFDYAGLNKGLALAPVFMLPSAHYKDVGVRIASFVGSRSGAVSLRFRLPGAPRFLWEWTHERNRKPVSRPRHLERRGRISRATLSCGLHVKAYTPSGTGTAFMSAERLRL